jgi:hypothetical protein
MSDHDLNYEKAVIEAANNGEDSYGREALEIIAERIERGLFDSPLFTYLATNLRAYLDQGVPLERALGVETELNPGGRPKKYNDTEIAAVDILLRYHADFSLEQANIWIEERIGADRRFVQKRRLEHDSTYNSSYASELMESLSLDDLLHLSGSMREKVAEVLPHT